MSATVGTSTYSQLDLLLAGASSLRNQYSKLQSQTTTGLVSQSYGGLATQASQVLNVAAASAENVAYAQVLTQAQGKASVMQSAITQMGSLVSTLSASALSASGTSSGSAVTSMASQAREALSQLVSLLNTQYEGDYVFSGADTSNPPVPAPNSVTSSGMFTQIGAQVGALATSPTNPPVSTVIANTVSIAASPAAGTTIFSSYLTGPGATAVPTPIQISDSRQISLDLLANRNVGAVSDPSINGTGSAIGDIMRSLSVMANSTGAMATNPDFAQLMHDAASTLTSAGATLAEEGDHIGQAQIAMTTAATANTSMQTLLATQLSNLTNVDMPTAISNLQQVNNQLQASYRVLAEVSSLNLASFL